MPRSHGGAEIADDEAFVRWLLERRREGHEICLHGLEHRTTRPVRSPSDLWAHRIYTAGEAEFHNLGPGEARERILEGRAILRRAGLDPAGFVAPAWLMSRATVETAAELGFRFTTRLHDIVLLPEGLAFRAPSIVFSTRAAWRRAASRLWLPIWTAANRRARILRLVAHPADFGYAEIETLLFGLLARAARQRESATYEEVVNRIRRQESFQ